MSTDNSKVDVLWKTIQFLRRCLKIPSDQLHLYCVGNLTAKQKLTLYSPSLVYGVGGCVDRADRPSSATGLHNCLVTAVSNT